MMVYVLVMRCRSRRGGLSAALQEGRLIIHVVVVRASALVRIN